MQTEKDRLELEKYKVDNVSQRPVVPPVYTESNKLVPKFDESL